MTCPGRETGIRRRRTARRSVPGALLPVLFFALFASFAAQAEPLPAPEVPPASIYTIWLEREHYEREFWIRGMNDRHWITPESHPREWLSYNKDEVRVLPESGLVLWLRRPAVLDHLSPLVDGEDRYGNGVLNGWPGAARRDVMNREAYLARIIREQRRRLLLDKAGETRREVAAAEAHGSLIDINIPLKLPERIERIVGRGEKSNITVTGTESITFSGETTHNSNYKTDESGKGQSLFPRLEMKQDLRVKLSGTVGEKIHVEVENNSNDIGLADNKIRIRYEGDEDEVIKLIEMGDTQLSLPSAGLISYSTSNKGLFGIKVNGNVGALDFTAIASKQEGEVQSKTFNASGQSEQETFIYDTNFLANQFFYLNNPDAAGGAVSANMDIATLQIWIDTAYHNTSQELEEYPGFAFVDENNDDALDIDPDNPDDAGGEKGIFRLLQENEYRLWMVDEDIGYIQLLTTFSETHTLAISYRTVDGVDVGTVTRPSTVLKYSQVGPDYAGLTYQDTDRVLHLELIKPSDFKPTSPTWRYMKRDVYRLGGSDIDIDALNLEIRRLRTGENLDSPEEETVEYMQVFGLDQYATTQTDSTPNGQVDPIRIDEELGLLFFPASTPFDPPAARVREWTANVSGYPDGYALAEDDGDRNPALYTTKYSDIQRNPTEYSKYSINFVSASASSRFNLNAFNIIEGSESVTVDGRQLARGTDYKIDYFTGEVELLGDAALDLRPDSQVSIKVETKPLFGGGKSSLLGLHGTYNLGDKNKISSSWLYESQATGARRPRIGEESTRNIVGNILGSYAASPQFLTSLVNVLPRVDTDAASTFSVSGELAMSYPNPNVDNDAYVDDMEGAEDADDLSISRSQWSPASVPISPIRIPGGADIEPSPENRARHFAWHHLDPNADRVTREEFNLNLHETEADDTVEILRLKIPAHLTSDEIAEFSPIASVNDANNAQGDGLWAGLMRGFGGAGLDLSEAEYLEIWVNDFQQDAFNRVGRIHFDMGTISENFHNPDVVELDTEDKVEPYGSFQEIKEDFGFDNLRNGSEPNDVDDPHPLRDTNSPAWGGTVDDAGDDYRARDFGFYKVNGTEYNGRLDTEDLNGNSLLDTSNSYFTLDFSLADSAVIDMVDVYDEAGEGAPPGGRSWRLYRLNLDDAVVVEDNGAEPDWSRIQYFRFWVEGLNTPTGNADHAYLNTLEIASIKLVGNRWRAHGVQEVATGTTLPPAELDAGEDLRVEVINTKDNATFTWPFGSELDPETGLPEREQALDFIVEDLQPGHQAVIRKDYTKLDLMGYQGLSFYLRPDLAMVGRDIFLRAAFDSTEYYEVVVRPETTSWLEVNLDLADWTDLKLSADADTVSAVIRDAVAPDREYTIRCVGMPELTNIRHLYLGVVNDTDEPLTGEIWLNDIRVRSVRRDVGYAGKINGQVNMGGIVSLNASYENRSADFRTLRSTTGSNAHTRSWSVSGRTSLEHFVPLRGYKVPLSLNYSRSTSTPKYEPNSEDILIEDDVLKDRFSTRTVNQGFSTNLSRSPSRNWFSRTFLDNFKFDLKGSQVKKTGPSTISLSESVNYGLSHSTSFKERQLNLPRGVRFRWMPASLSLKSTTARSWTKRWTSMSLDSNLFQEEPYAQTGTMNNNFSLKWDFFPSLKTTIDMSERRELLHEAAESVSIGDFDVNLGFQKSQSQTFTANCVLPFIPKFKPRVTYKSSFTQTNQASTTNTGEAAVDDRNFSGGNRISTGYTFKVGKLFKRMVGNRLDERKADDRGPRPPTQPPAQMRVGGQRVLVPVAPERGPDPRMRNRRTRRWFPDVEPVIAQPVAAAADSVDARGGVDVGVIFWHTLAQLGDLKDIKVDVSRDVSNSYSHVRGKSGPLYRFGFSDELGLPAHGAEGAERLTDKEPDKNNRSLNVKASTGMTVGGVVSISSKFNQTMKKSDSYTSRTETMDRKWPDFSLEVANVNKWPLWRGKFKSSSIGCGFTRDLKITENLAVGSKTRRVSLGLSPRWTVTWVNKMNTTLNLSYNSDANYQTSSTTKTSRYGGDFSMNYSLSAPNGISFPGMGGISFASTLDLALTLKYNRSRTKSNTSDDYKGSSTFSVSPSAHYKFSQKLSGNARLSFSRTHNDDSGATTTVVGLSVGATFTF